MRKVRERQAHLSPSRAGTRVPFAPLFSAVLLTTAVLLVTGATGTARGDASCEQYGCPISDQEGAGQAATREEPAPSDPAGTPAQQQYEPAPVPPSPEPAPAPAEQYATPATTTPGGPASYQRDPAAGSAQYQAPVGGAQPAPGQGPIVMGEPPPPAEQQPSQGLAPEADPTIAPEPPAGFFDGGDLATTEPAQVASAPNADENGNDESAVPATPADDAPQPAEEAEPAAPSADEPEGGAEEPPPSPTDDAGTVEQSPSGEGEQGEEPPPASFGPVEECTVSNCGELADPFYGDCAIYETAAGARVIGCTVTLEPEFREPGECPSQAQFFLPAGVLAGGYSGDWYTPYAPYATTDACQGAPVVPPEPPNGWWYDDLGANGSGGHAECYDAEGVWDRHCGLDVPPRYSCAVYGGTVDGTVRGCITGPAYDKGTGGCYPMANYDMEAGQKLGDYTMCDHVYKQKVCGEDQCGTRPPAPERFSCAWIDYQYGSMYPGRQQIICVDPVLLEMQAGERRWDPSRTCLIFYDGRGNLDYKAACKPGGGDDMGLGSWAADDAEQAEDALENSGGGTGNGGGSGIQDESQSDVVIGSPKSVKEEEVSTDEARPKAENPFTELASAAGHEALRKGSSTVVPQPAPGAGLNQISPVAIPYSRLVAGPVFPPPHSSGDYLPSEGMSGGSEGRTSLRGHEGPLYLPGRTKVTGDVPTVPDAAAILGTFDVTRTATANSARRGLAESSDAATKPAEAPLGTGDARDEAAESPPFIGLGSVVPVLVVAALGSIVVARRRFTG